MKNTFAGCLIAMLCASCAVTGPAPTEAAYSQAAKSLPVAKEAKYSMSAGWYPNTILGSTESFHAKPTPGRLFVTEDRLSFAAYDEITNTFLAAYETSYSNIQWLTLTNLGLSRLVRLQAGNSVHSFAFSAAATGSGSIAEKDEVVRFLSAKFPPKQ